MAAGAGFHGYGCGFPWKTPGLPVTIPINEQIVSEMRLALHKEMVLRPPENILSTATAEPSFATLVGFTLRNL